MSTGEANRRLAVPLLAATVLLAWDRYWTLQHVYRGQYNELNPIAWALLEIGPWAFVGAAGVALAVIGASCWAVERRASPWGRRGAWYAAGLVGLVAVGNFVATLLPPP